MLSTLLGLLLSLNLQQSFHLTLNVASRTTSSDSVHPHSLDSIQGSKADIPEDTETIRHRHRVRDLQDESIRSWGCGRNETPLIFVHIGKAGGGNVRRRIAASALNVTRSSKQWRHSHVDQHYYPSHQQQQHHAKFCSSGRHRHLPIVTKSYERYSQRCTAETPLGHVLACPEIFNEQCRPYDPTDQASAHLVYVGHNFLGTELHWLPIPYLQEWWQNQWAAAAAAALATNKSQDDDRVISKFKTLDGVQPWCKHLPRPLHFVGDQHSDNEYWDCAQQYLEPEADALARETLQQTFGVDILELPQHRGRAYGQIYASLPVIRVTILREPISWLLSKWSWHKLGTAKYNTMPCDDIDLATRIVHEHMDGIGEHDNDHVRALHNFTRPGWVRIMSLQYIMYLCGEDCYTRWETPVTETTLAEIEAQAAYNLRNSFAVVGLLHQQDAFFEMLHERVQYVDFHLDHAGIFGGGDHESRKNRYCQERFQSKQFQLELVAASPELQALIRLYAIGVQVNRVHMQELETCSGRTLLVEGYKQHFKG